MRFNFVLILSLIFTTLTDVSHVFAQERNIRFKHISYKDGLIQSPVASMVQDRSGYIWIGNWSGLSRYDGAAFKNFRQSDASETAISHNRINKVCEDRNGNLWIATGGGLNRYDKRTEHFLHVGMLPGKGGGNYIASLHEDSYGKIWVSTFGGLKFVNPEKDTLETVPLWKSLGEDELFQGISFSLFNDQQKTVWVGIKQGLKRIDPESKRIIPLPEIIRTNKDLNASKIVVIQQDSTGVMWFGTEENGLFRYSAKDNYCVRYVYNENDRNSLPSNWINDLLISEGKVWIATRNGLSIYDPQKNLFSNYRHDSADPKSLNDDSVWSLMKDKAGNIWIGTYAGGINIYYPGISNFTHIGERIGNNIGLNKTLANAIVEDNDDGLWIGTFGGGLNYINRTRNISRYYSVKDVTRGKLSNEIKSLTKDRTGKLWIGTMDGLCSFDPTRDIIKYFNFEILNSKTTTKLINALLLDEDGIWVGTNGGGLRFITFNGVESESFISRPDNPYGLSDNYINALVKDGDHIWIGTQNGLNRFNPNTKTFTIYKRVKSIGLGNNNVLSLFKDAHNRLWIGTDGGGLNCLDLATGKVYLINQASGLVDDVIASIVEDDHHRLWVSTNNGLSQITFKSFSFPLDTVDYSIVNYSSANGLPGNQFSTNAGIKTRRGEILFGGMNGVTSFYPEHLFKNTIVPEILLTGFAINNKEMGFGNNSPLKYPVNETSQIVLPHDHNTIAIRFSSLNLINPEKNVYAYRITGIGRNDEWTEIGNQKEVSFINLAPGKYVFDVKAANNDGVWNHAGRSLSITILPPVWRTWWAYALYVMITVSVAYKVIQFFRIRAKLERDLYNEHLQNERQEEFYKMKLDFFTNISHEIRTPLSLILGPLENLEKKTQDDSFVNRQVQQIKNNTDRLLRLIGELMDFRKAETGNMMLYLKRNNIIPFIKEIFLSFQSLAASRNIKYDFIAEEHQLFLHIDRNQLEKVFFNLLSNAFKFTPDNGEIKLEVLKDNESCIVKITDNGKGIPAEYQDKLFTNFYQVQPDKAQPGTGVGLALSKSIIALHQGNIKVESSPAHADRHGKTVFTVILPFDVTASENVRIDKSDFEDAGAYLIKAEAIPDDVRVSGIVKGEEKKYTVLVAEDNEELRNFIIESLSDYQVISSVNGSDAFDKAIEQIPDLIVSDVMMPLMNGLELCKKIKIDDRTSHIPVMLLTALGAHIHQVNGLQTGADVYMTKPFSTKLLELNVHNLLATRELMRKKFAQQITLQPLNIPISSPDEGFIKKLMQVIEERMEDPEFGVVELGEEIAMSKTVLYKKIVALTDLSPADFIKSMRLKKAAFLLQQNVHNINEVATLVGFNDSKYFSKEFKKFHGKSPSELLEV